MESLDQRVRLAAFEYLNELRDVHGDELPFKALSRGFKFEGRRVALLGPQGIFKPAILPELPISITTAPPKPGKPPPYPDEVEGENRILYCYRGDDPNHHENVGLRKAMQREVPLIYFFGIVKGLYLATYPAYVVGDDSSRLMFTVELAKQQVLGKLPESVREGDSEARRAYLAVPVLRRLHQRSFRRRVLDAYRENCAVCRLRHAEFLDAAHIIPDSEPRGDPVVPNGLSLCKLHHAAYDEKFLGIRPDLKIEIREDLLREEDGPMLVHGLQGFQGRKIHIPRSPHLRPDPERLEERFERFRRAM